MSSSTQVHLVPDKIWHIDWYDGVIRGLARAQDHYYLFTLAAWDPDSRRRAYVILKLDHATADEMIRLCKLNPVAESDDDEMRWRRLNQIYDRYVMDYHGAAYLSNEEPHVTESFAMTPIPLDHIAELRGFDIENTMDAKTQKLWFDMQTSLCR